MNQKKVKREVRKKRIRKNVYGTLERPRLSVFKSNKYIYAQIINDVTGKTMLSLTTKVLGSKGKTMANVTTAAELGEKIGEMALKKKIKTVTFDRGGYKYHGRVKSLADGARKAGLIF